MIPVHELSIEQAVAELEQIADAKPSEDQVIERARWFKQHGDRITALEARILSTEPSTHIQEDAPMPSPKTELTDLLARRVAKYREIHAKLVADPADQKTRTRLNMVRHEIRDFAKRAGVPVPEIPEAPVSPLATPPKAECAAAPTLPVEPVRIPLEVRIECSTPLQSVARVRREIWLLMAELEQMTPAERSSLSQEIGLLDAAAHAALGLTTGQLQVV